MTSFTEQIKQVRKFKVKEGYSLRFDCPWCGGYNTLGVSNIGGVLEWNCFKSSCSIKGKSNDGISIEGIKDKINSTIHNKFIGKAIPELASIKPIHVEYLNKFNCVYPDLKYSPTEDRIMFPVYANPFSDIKVNPVGYTGRKIINSRPKWVKYGDCSSLFTCGIGSIGVLVEDALSAGAVGKIPGYTGIALLGTTLTNKHRMQIMESRLQKMYVCLDPDAYNKSLSISVSLSSILPSTMKLIPDDLKYYNQSQIKQILEGKV